MISVNAEYTLWHVGVVSKYTHIWKTSSDLFVKEFPFICLLLKGFKAESTAVKARFHVRLNKIC